VLLNRACDGLAPLQLARPRKEPTVKDIRTLAAALLLAATSTGVLAANSTATIDDVQVVVANLDPGNTSTPGYGVEVIFSDATAEVDGIFVQFSDEQFGFMTPVSQTSLPLEPDANSSAAIVGSTLTGDAFATGTGSAIGAASTGAGSFILDARTSLTLSGTISLSSSGSGATAIGLVCLVTCTNYAVGAGETHTYSFESTVSNTTDDFESFFVSLGAEADVVAVPEVSPLFQMLAGLAAVGLVRRPRRNQA
jgi:hypothetical protein